MILWWGIFFSNRFVGELYEAVDVMIFVYAKPYESMFVLIKCYIWIIKVFKKLLKILMYLTTHPRR